MEKSYGLGASSIGGADAAKMAQAFVERTQAGAGQQTSAPGQDPASLRQQFAALCQVCERLNSQRNRLREIADTVLGGEPEEVAAGQGANAIPVVGGLTQDIMDAFKSVAMMLGQIDHQINRLSRVSS